MRSTPSSRRPAWTRGACAVLVGLLGAGVALPAAAATPAQPASPAAATATQSTTNSEPAQVQFSAKDGTYVRPPQVVASSWIVADAQTGEIFASKDPDRLLPPASTLKALTAVSLIERIDGDSLFAPTLQDINQPGTKIGLRAGTPFLVSDLFAGMMMNSGNDAASALANAYGGWDNTVALMNREAQRLGATNTNALTPNGLDRSDQVSTSRDLATIFRAAIEVPAIRSILKTKTQWMESPTTGRKMNLYNQNAMLQWDYPGHIGAKTGYTSMAGNTLVAASERGGRTLVMAAMRTGQKMNVIAPRLFDWVATNDENLDPIGELPEPQSAATFEKLPAIQMEQEGAASPGQEELLIKVGALTADPGGKLTDSKWPASSTAILVLLVGLGLGATLVVFLRNRRSSR